MELNHDRVHQIQINLTALNIPPHVKILAATKTQPESVIRAAYMCGLREIGENYVNEAQTKRPNLADLPDLRWHCIGHLQSNKIRSAAECFDVIQTIDSPRMAEKLDHACADIQKTMPVLVQINIGYESQKSGILPEDLPRLLALFPSLPNLALIGLMCIPPADRDPIPFFRQMHAIFEKYRLQYGLTELSMGMSDDYHHAIAYGATVVRIGTKLFGRRESSLSSRASKI